MVNNPDLITIIKAGNLAPSGGNSQPWSFEISDASTILVKLHPEGDHPVLNYSNRGSFVAFGALLETMRIKALSMSYEVVEEKLTDFEVKLKLRKGSEKPSKDILDLEAAIEDRHSNRKPYKTEALDTGLLEKLTELSSAYDGASLKVITDRGRISKITDFLAKDIEVNLSNQHLHKLLFNEVLWKEKDQHTRGGLYIKTMEMKWPQSMMFKMVSKWDFVKKMHSKGLPQKISTQVGEKASHAGAVICFFAKDPSWDSYVDVGRLLQRAWLLVSAKSYFGQVMAGLPFLYQQLEYGKSDLFDKEQATLIRSSYHGILNIVDSGEDEALALCLRVGKAKNPLATSFKRPAVIN